MIRRSFTWLCLALLALPLQAQSLLPSPPALAATSWVLAEFPSGQVLTTEKADEQRAPASLTKLMTAYLAFSAIRQNTLSLDSNVTISEKAWRSGGSKMFIKVGNSVPVRDLLMGMIVQSGNDASIALAEAIAGTEENFAQLMNREAARLGMKNSHFVNATGLPDPAHVSTANDLTLLAIALIRDFPEEYARHYSQKEYRYNNISQPNRNRLLWMDQSVDGMKTGFTSTAGYCLVSSAKRGDRRLISVVMGADSERSRASESLKLLNWGYQFFDAVRLYSGGESVSAFRVWKGDKSTIKVGFPHDFVIAVPKPEANKLEAKLTSLQPLMAPVKKGQAVGTLNLSIAGQPYGEFPVLALEDVAPGGWFSRLFDSIRLWFS